MKTSREIKERGGELCCLDSLQIRTGAPVQLLQTTYVRLGYLKCPGSDRLGSRAVLGNQSRSLSSHDELVLKLRFWWSSHIRTHADTHIFSDLIHSGFLDKRNSARDEDMKLAVMFPKGIDIGNAANRETPGFEVPLNKGNLHLKQRKFSEILFLLHQFPTIHCGSRRKCVPCSIIVIPFRANKKPTLETFDGNLKVRELTP